MHLGINIDHVATLRQARGGHAPEPLTAALLAQEAGADNITVHLREDRRHIQDKDLVLLKELLAIPINFEMAATKEMVAIAKKIKPAMCCIVPEKRQELTTEGGLNVTAQKEYIKDICKTLTKQGIEVSLFIDADEKQIKVAADCGAQAVELHTGSYAEAKDIKQQQKYLAVLKSGAEYANKLGLVVHAGHGLNYHNVTAVAQIDHIEALMIGHGIIARSIFVGIPAAVQEMKNLLHRAQVVKRIL